MKARREKSQREFTIKMHHHDAEMESAKEAQRKGGEYDAVAAERDRYRAALSEIAGYYENTTGVHVDILIDIAREALEVTP